MLVFCIFVYKKTGMNLKLLKTDKDYNTTKYLFELNDGMY